MDKDENYNKLSPMLDVVYLVQHNYEWFPITVKVFKVKEDAEYYKKKQGPGEHWEVVEFKVY